MYSGNEKQQEGWKTWGLILPLESDTSMTRCVCKLLVYLFVKILWLAAVGAEHKADNEATRDG